MSSVVGDPVGPDRASIAPRSGLSLTDASLLLMSVIWGINYSVVKYGTVVLEPLAFNAARVALAAAVLLVVAGVMQRRWPTAAVARRLVVLGILGNGVYQYLFINGIALTRAGDAALVIAASPAFVAIVGRARGVERVNRRGAIGIALSLLGVAFVVLGSKRLDPAAVGMAAPAPLLGNMLIMTGSLIWAFYTVWLKPYTHEVSGIQLSALTMLGGTIPLALLGAPALLRAQWGGVSASGWGAMVYSGIGALVIAYLLWYRGVRVIGPTRTAMYANLQPVVAVLVAWILLSELPTAWQGLGAASIITGLLLSRS